MKINFAPTNSTYSGTAIGALVVLIGWGLSFIDVSLPTEVAGALVVLMSFLTSSVVPDSEAQTNAAVKENEK